MNAPLLTATDVTVRFGGVTAVSSVSFDVRRGEFFAIIGPNGAGKTTLFNCLSGLVRYSGDITFDGSSIVGKRADQIAQVGIARTFQNLGLFSTMTVCPRGSLSLSASIRAMASRVPPAAKPTTILAVCDDVWAWAPGTRAAAMAALVTSSRARFVNDFICILLIQSSDTIG